MIRDTGAFERGGYEGGGAGYLCVDCSVFVGYKSLHI